MQQVPLMPLSGTSCTHRSRCSTGLGRWLPPLLPAQTPDDDRYLGVGHRAKRLVSALLLTWRQTMDQQLSGSAPELAPALPASDAAVARLLCEVLVPQLETGSMQFLLVDTAQAETDAPLSQIPLGSHRVHDGSTGCHVHETPEVCWVVDGRCLLWVAGHIVPLDPDSACIVRPGQAHQLRPTPQLTPFRTLWWLATPGGGHHV